MVSDNTPTSRYHGAPKHGDPAGLLEDTGKFMRHVKLAPRRDVDEAALTNLIRAAYSDMKGWLV